MISVCITTYNRPTWLIECLDSVLAEKDVKLEVLVLDNGSTDGQTPAILDEFKRKDPRVKSWRVEENGKTHSWIFLAEKSAGDAVQFLCDDDLVAPGGLKKKYELLMSNDNLGFVFSPVTWMSEDGLERYPSTAGRISGQTIRSGATTFAGLFLNNIVPFGANLFRAKYIPELAIMHHPGAMLLTDWAFHLELAHIADSGFVPQDTLIERKHGSQDSTANGYRNGQFLEAYLGVWRLWLNRGHIPTQEDWETMRQVYAAVASRTNPNAIMQALIRFDAFRREWTC